MLFYSSLTWKADRATLKTHYNFILNIQYCANDFPEAVKYLYELAAIKEKKRDLVAQILKKIAEQDKKKTVEKDAEMKTVVISLPTSYKTTDDLSKFLSIYLPNTAVLLAVYGNFQ